ncbi:MAG: RraA family protein [Chloroflexi bacterium]|nr:RraA family protein [Chloroflexota bacterium]
MESHWKHTLDCLRKYDTPTICNVIELFDIRPRNTGYMDARIVAAFPEMPPMVGFAATATFRASAQPRGNDGYSSIDKQVERFSELSGPVVVVFQDLDSPSGAAIFGEIMCRTYQAFGAVGLVTSGTGRDLDQVRRIRFPVFTNGAICSHGYMGFPQIHVPVHVGGITVFPDDLLHGDCNGVTTIPKEIAAEIIDIADEFVSTEAMVIEILDKRPGDLKALRECRAEAKDRRERLRARASRAHKE